MYSLAAVVVKLPRNALEFALSTKQAALWFDEGKSEFAPATITPADLDWLSPVTNAPANGNPEIRADTPCAIDVVALIHPIRLTILPTFVYLPAVVNVPVTVILETAGVQVPSSYESSVLLEDVPEPPASPKTTPPER
jgi:hypothetical protein